MKKYYRPGTTDWALEYFSINEETLFWSKIDVAKLYLKDKYGDEFGDYMVKQSEFWNWFLRMWETQDKRFMNLSKSSKKGYTLKDYTWYQYYQNLHFQMDPKDVQKFLNQYKNTTKDDTSKESIDH